MAVPAYTPSEAQARETFLALMWSLSYPGRIYTLPANGHGLLPFIGMTLLDLESSYFTPDAGLAQTLAQTGARTQPAAKAAYHFYPAFTSLHLGALSQSSSGTLLYPDESATVVIGCQIGNGVTYILSGPGIVGQRTICLGGIPAEFWSLRAAACRYPLGWDVYFVDGQQIIGLPRSVTVKPGDSEG